VVAAPVDEVRSDLPTHESSFEYKPPSLRMHRILFLPDIRPAGYLANPKAGYRISGRILTWLYNYIFDKISNNL
jgi:hypothetical protein